MPGSAPFFRHNLQLLRLAPLALLCALATGCRDESSLPAPTPTPVPSSPVVLLAGATSGPIAASSGGKVVVALESPAFEERYRIFQVDQRPPMELPAPPGRVDSLAFDGETLVAGLRSPDWKPRLARLEGQAWEVSAPVLGYPSENFELVRLYLSQQGLTSAVAGLWLYNWGCGYTSNVLLATTCVHGQCAPQTQWNQPSYTDGLPDGPHYGEPTLSANPEGKASLFHNDLENSSIVERSLPDGTVNSRLDRAGFDDRLPVLLQNRLYLLGWRVGGRTLQFSSRAGQSKSWSVPQLLRQPEELGLSLDACACKDAIHVVWNRCSYGQPSGLYHAIIHGERWGEDSLIPGTEFICDSQGVEWIRTACAADRLHVVWTSTNEPPKGFVARHLSLPIQ